MAFKRRYGSRLKRRAFGRKRYGGSLYRKRYRRVSTMRNVEKKYSANNDWTAETMDDYTAPSTNFNMLRLGAGTDSNTRVGLRVFSKYLVMRFHTEQSSSISIDSFRVDLWMDKQPDATNPSWTDLYYTGSTATDCILAPKKDQAQYRFKLLKSKTFSDRTLLTSTTGPVSAGGQHNWKWFVRTNKMLSYNSSAAGNPNRGCNLFLIAWSTTTTNTPKIYCYAMHCFTDM